MAIRSGSCGVRQRGVDAFEHQVQDDLMRLLHVGAGGVGDEQFDVGLAVEGAAAAANQGERLDAARLGGADCFDQVGGVAARREEDEQVAGGAERLDLAGEDLVEAEIVGDAGERRAVGADREAGQGAAVALVAAGEFFGEMHCLGRAAAVAGAEHLAAGFQGGDEQVDGRLDGRSDVVKGSDRGRGLVDESRGVGF